MKWSEEQSKVEWRREEGKGRSGVEGRGEECSGGNGGGEEGGGVK